MAYTFTRKTDNVDKIMAVDVNELQAAIEDVSTDVDTMSNINATFFLSAASITPAITSGCSDPTQFETTTYKINSKVAYFDKDTVETGWWNHPLPSDYNGGTITFRVFWHHSTATAYKVAWDLAASAISNNQGVGVNVGTAVQVNDEGGSTTFLYITDFSAPVTIANSPAAGNMVFWRLRRVATDGTNDTLDTDAGLYYVEIRYTRA